MAQRIGFLGLGLMGRRMARRFLDQGHPLTVWNRTAERAAALRDAGATVARTPREVAEASDVVICCLADPGAVGRAVFADDGVRPAAREGLRYVETSTISPGLARRLEESLGAQGTAVLEAPVTGSKNGAEAGTLVFMTGGPAALHDEMLPVLQVMGTRFIHCGPVGSASTVKLIGNTIISFMLEGLGEGAVLARKAGIPLEKVLEVVMASGYASPYYTFKGGALQRRDFETHFSIDLMVKDQNLMMDEAHRHQVSLPGLAAIREVFQSARAQGMGGEDIVAVVKVLERASGLGE